MSRIRYTYTIEQLLALQHSPLIKKPDDLPRIEQWIDAPIDPSQRRARPQGSLLNGKGEENEHPGKKPSLFESRQRQSQSQSGEDIFLGPKMSFASASAARQTNRRGATEEKSTSSTTEDTRDRFDRFGGKDRLRRDGFNDRDGKERDFESFRSRFGRQNGFQDEDEPRGKRGDYLDRGKEARDGGVTLDGQASRRTGPSRGKFDQPWHRDANKTEAKDDRGFEEVQETRGWRDNERRNDRWTTRDTKPERDPQWMAEPALGDSGDPTQEDFQKWKEKMKAGSEQKPQATEDSSTAAEPITTLDTAPSTDQTNNNPPVDEAYFGIFGDQPRDTTKSDGQPPTPKPTAKPKASRFAGMFKGTQDITSPPAPEPMSPVAEPPPARAPPKKTEEDQQGFERMMQMLRMGGASQGPPPQLFGRPPSSHLAGDPGRAPDMSPVHDRGILSTDPVPRGGFASPNQPQIPKQAPQQSQEAGVPPMFDHGQRPERSQRPEHPGRDSSFLLKLMQQPPSGFTEGQIYGQSYNRNEPDNSNPYLSGFQSKPQESRARALPPGLYGNEGAFVSNHNMDGHVRPDGPIRQPPPMQINERFGGPLPRPNPGDEGHMHPPSMFDQFAPNNNPRPNPPPGHDGISPPPGFPSARGQAPPGFFPFAGGNLPGPPQQQPPFGNGPPPPNARGPMPPSHSQPPQGFYNPPLGVPNQGLPPGFPPQMPNPQQNRGQPMRPPVPPGHEGYGDAGRRGPQPPPPPPPQMQSQWPPQFVKQMGGGYQGM